MNDSGRLRITVLTDKFLPHAGGSRFYYYNLFRRISKLDDVLLLTTKIPGCEAFDASVQGPSFRISRRFSPLRDLSYSQLLKLAGTLLRAISIIANPPDVLHCGDLYPPGIVGVILKKILGIPFVAYAHGEEFTLTGERKYQPMVRDVIYLSADAVVANGTFAEQRLLDIGVSARKIFKVTPGLDTAVFFPQPADELRKRYGVDQELVIMTVARLAPQKGHSRVIRAIAALGNDVPRFKYIIAGKGPQEASLKQLALSVGVSDKVIFAGFVPDVELNSHYNLADLVVMPNVQSEVGDLEGFGMVFLEANATGKAVIGGRSGGTADAVEQAVTGFLVDPDDDAELIEKLRLLLIDSELRKRMGSAGLDRVRNQFSWEPRSAVVRKLTADIAASRKEET